ncbi:ParB N-terminal domain-containing protein [Cereibacter johrii]|uniref:ParB N-terminal domain-containing protein n=1 Tax=Cereibacter johrii TaxID=445629 RepID=UPI002B25FE27|nr:ParB N-terminal domain-containing protein [Cereibacter johrii]MEA5163356.1 ParB N-terminal domain-containing protein [Cereibacter johrii]
MVKGNRFGIGPIETPTTGTRRSRDPGPMGVAVRESAASAQEASDALVEQRRQNAADAREFRAARDEGRVLVRLPVGEIEVDQLPRDRLDLEGIAESDEMEELKASIRERGQREPIEVYLSSSGRYQLKKGWRRLTALRQLHAESQEDRFACAIARVTTPDADRADLYVDMVEENVIRQDLSFAEMAQIALALAADPQAGVGDADAAVARLYRSLHKVKRSYIRSFVALMTAVGEDLPFPKGVPRDLGVDVARKLGDGLEIPRSRLAACTSVEEQNDLLRGLVKGAARPAGVGVAAAPTARQKYEFRVGDTKVTARNGEFRIRAACDYSGIERRVLERAVRAFQDALSRKE